jgi:uncharacterized membrane protein
MNEELPKHAEEFLRRLRAGLAGLAREEQNDIVAEIRSHLLERHAAGRAELLDGFESAEAYAARFLAEHELASAVARGTSVALGRALLVGARDTLGVLLLVVPLLVLDLIALAFVVVGALKVLLPDHVGLFLDVSGRFKGLGLLRGPFDGLHEVLGWWAVPLFIVPGIVVVWTCNRGLRALARWRLRVTREARVPGL